MVIDDKVEQVGVILLQYMQIKFLLSASLTRQFIGYGRIWGPLI